MKINISRKISVSLHLTEEEAHVVSAGLYALKKFVVENPEWENGDTEVKAFGDDLASVRESLQAKLGEAGLWPSMVCEGLERGPYFAVPVMTEEERLEREQARRTNNVEKGFDGLCGEGRDVLQQLLTWAWKHPERFVHATCSRPCVGGSAYMSQSELDEHWFPHIDFLTTIRRITPTTIDGKDGWIVPSAKEWRNLMREQAKTGPRLVG